MLRSRFPPAESLHQRGLAAYQKGDREGAIALISQAAKLAPAHAIYSFNLARLHEESGQLEPAIVNYRKAIELAPDNAHAHNNFGAVLRATGRYEQAAAAFLGALTINPQFADAYYNLGLVRAAQGALDAAAGCFRQALARRPDFWAALNELGAILTRQARFEEAISCFQRILAVTPEHAHTHFNLGATYLAQARFPDAIGCFAKALAVKPDWPAAQNNLGLAYEGALQWEQAADCYRRAIASDPNFADAHYNLGKVLREQGALEAAEESYRRALRIVPGLVAAHNNLGIVLHQARKFEDATIAFEAALALAPEQPDALYNLGTVQLATGDLAAGFENYEARWRTPQMLALRRNFSQPAWAGGVGDGTLLIHAEQGFGDTLQFCRFASLTGFSRVILEVQPALTRLLACLPNVDKIVAAGDPLPGFDMHVPLLSLPHVLGATWQTIPTAPYLTAPAHLVSEWGFRVTGAGVRVGLVWAGNPRKETEKFAAIDRRRSIAPHLLQPLFEVPGAAFYSLQKGGPTAPDGVHDVMADVEDFADTAAIISHLDLVIAVDTAVAHLAAAMGRPVWLLNRHDSCWRWLHDRQDSPWYPSLRLYNQPAAGDWGSVVAAMAADLAALCAARRSVAQMPEEPAPTSAMLAALS